MIDIMVSNKDPGDSSFPPGKLGVLSSILPQMRWMSVYNVTNLTLVASYMEASVQGHNSYSFVLSWLRHDGQQAHTTARSKLSAKQMFCLSQMYFFINHDYEYDVF